MSKNWRGAATLAAVAMSMGSAASAQDMCASEEQAQQIQAFYAENPGTMTPIASQRLNLPEALVVSGLSAEQAASTTGDAFMDVWTNMTTWEKATFLVMKGKNVFEIETAIAPVKKSETSDYTNIEYIHPLRGHLRPDLYSSISAVVMPVEGRPTIRGVVFFDPDGSSIMGAFISGEGAGEPPAEELAKFDALMAMIREKPPVCAE